MNYVLGALLLLLLLLCLLSLLKVQGTFGYRSGAPVFRLRIGCISLEKREKGRHKEKPPKEPPRRETDESLLKKARQWKQFWKNGKPYLAKALRRGRKKLRIERLMFHYRVGFQDAALSAVCYGLVSGMVYELYALVQHWVGVEQSDLQLVPELQQRGVWIETEWVLSLRIWHFFYIGAALLPLLRVKRKAGL